jgi:hypothetical protein
MKITYSLLALLGSAVICHAGFSSGNNGPLSFCVMQDSHGGSHFVYYQPDNQQDTTVALSTNSGGPMSVQQQTDDNGGLKFVIGTNQHAQSSATYIQPTSHFAPAQQ